MFNVWQIKRDKLQMCWSLLVLDCRGLILLYSVSVVFWHWSCKPLDSPTHCGSQVQVLRRANALLSGLHGEEQLTMLTLHHYIHNTITQFDTTSRISVDWNNACILLWSTMILGDYHLKTWDLPTFSIRRSVVLPKGWQPSNSNRWPWWMLVMCCLKMLALLGSIVDVRSRL